MIVGGINFLNFIVFLFVEFLVFCWVVEIVWKMEIDKDRKRMLILKVLEYWYGFVIEIYIYKMVCNMVEVVYYVVWCVFFMMQCYWICYII